jgi:hypothetical protein
MCQTRFSYFISSYSRRSVSRGVFATECGIEYGLTAEQTTATKGERLHCSIFIGDIFLGNKHIFILQYFL